VGKGERRNRRKGGWWFAREKHPNLLPFEIPNLKNNHLKKKVKGRGVTDEKEGGLF